jgi:acetyl-CoA synthetase
MAHERLHWDRSFKTVCRWFWNWWYHLVPRGLNASYNCVNHWSFKHPNNVNTTLLIFMTLCCSSDHHYLWGKWAKDGCLVTYVELLRKVCSIANILKALGVKKGNTIPVYLPMSWQSVLACAWIGAVHSVVFTDFCAESLCNHVQGCKSHWSGASLRPRLSADDDD